MSASPHPSLPAPATLFLVFNRPQASARVFAQIRAARPARLYIAADGPRATKPEEAARVEQVRALARAVDWPCTVRTLFREENLGCREAVSSAITWFFEQEPEGVVLEDDCVPGPDFFPYCAQLLERYRHDERIGLISGTALCDLQAEGLLWDDEDYVVCRYFSVWGWASWARVWKDYDVSIRSWTQRRADMSALTPDPRLRAINDGLFDGVATGRINTWDYQLSYLLWSTSRLALTPRTNLIENIGFDADATHTKAGGALAARARLGTQSLRFPLRAPAQLMPNLAYQRHLERFATRSRLQRLAERILHHVG